MVKPDAVIGMVNGKVEPNLTSATIGLLSNLIARAIW